MDNSIVRLQKIRIINLNQVRIGEASFPSYRREKYFSRGSDVLALFGQEGSGRSALINSLWLLKHHVLGENVLENNKYCIWNNDGGTSINYKFSIEIEEEKYLINYSIYINKGMNKSLEEHISWKKYLEDGLTRNKNFKIAYPLDYDSFFSVDLDKVRMNGKNIDIFKKIILALKHYVRKDLNIFRKNITSSILDSNLVKLMKSKDSKLSKHEGLNYLVSYNHPDIANNYLANNIEKLSYYISLILQKTFPDISVAAKETSETKEEKCINIELFSESELKLLKIKSEEIKNLISIMIILMPLMVNGSACVAIDKLNLDKIGEFKFELAELIKNEAKGQLVIVTNQFQFLNQLDKESLIYTSMNIKKRYMKFENITSIDDTKEFYYRSLYVKDLYNRKKAH